MLLIIHKEHTARLFFPHLLATNTDLDVRACGTPTFNSDLDQFAHTILVQYLQVGAADLYQHAACVNNNNNYYFYFYAVAKLPCIA